MEGEAFTSKEALDRGLIDEIILPDEYMKREFKGVNLEIYKGSGLDTLKDLKTSFMQDVNFD